MKKVIQITIENIDERQNRGHKAHTHNPALQVVHIMPQVPERGNSVLQLRDGNIYQVTHTTEENDNSAVRLQFQHSNSLVTVSLRCVESQQENPAMAEPISKDGQKQHPNQTEYPGNIPNNLSIQSRF